MNDQRMGAWALEIRLILARWGAMPWLALGLCGAGAVGWLAAIPYLEARIANVARTIHMNEQELRKRAVHLPVRLSLAEQRVNAFHDALGERRYAEQQVQTLSELAGKMGFVLAQAEYQPSFDKNGGFYRYQISLPVNRTYGDIRAFSEQALVVIPFASLDSVNFKREAITSRTVEARLQFTLYLSALKPAVSEVQAERAQSKEPS